MRLWVRREQCQHSDIEDDCARVAIVVSRIAIEATNEAGREARHPDRGLQEPRRHRVNVPQDNGEHIFSYWQGFHKRQVVFHMFVLFMIAMTLGPESCRQVQVLAMQCEMTWRRPDYIR